jgi:hypothetical protein
VLLVNGLLVSNIIVNRYKQEPHCRLLELTVENKSGFWTGILMSLEVWDVNMSEIPKERWYSLSRRDHLGQVCPGC